MGAVRASDLPWKWALMEDPKRSGDVARQVKRVPLPTVLGVGGQGRGGNTDQWRIL